MPPGASSAERKAAAVMLYGLPVVAFMAGFLLLTLGRISFRIQYPNVTRAALFCGVVGVLVHNFIDFAIFEPGVLTTFWAMIACLIAQDFHDRPRQQLTLGATGLAKGLCAIGTIVFVGAYLVYVFVPVVKATGSIRQALREPEFAHQLLDQAAEDDRLDPVALSLNGKLYLYEYKEQLIGRPRLLREAERCFLAVKSRSRVDYRNFERLTETYTLLAKSSAGAQEEEYLNKALDAAVHAVGLYPGSGRLRIGLAQAAEQIGKTDLAIENYEKAVGIEDAYREQFQIMYAGREIFSRLGQEEYNHAKQRIEELSQAPTP
jgi:tetratricopeptide (TPR) repeat protein